MRTTEAVDIIARVLSPHIGETAARAATVAHCRKLGVDERFVKTAQLEQLLDRLRNGLNVFVGKECSLVAITEARRALEINEEAVR
ncbi:MAG: hypothetical protein QM767_04950 [Anaeromyxobacter sp.]